MKIVIPNLAALFVVGTELMARAALKVWSKRLFRRGRVVREQIQRGQKNDPLTP